MMYINSQKGKTMNKENKEEFERLIKKLGNIINDLDEVSD